MKATKILAASILALTAVNAARADVTIHVTGSTAFRSSYVAAVENLMTSGYKCAYVASSASTNGERGASFCIIQGTIPSQSSLGVVTVKMSWAGSLGGVYTLATNGDITGLPNVTGWLSVHNLDTLSGNGTINVPTGNFAQDGSETLKADMTMSDTFQSSTAYKTPALTAAGTNAGVVGVIPFEWVANNGTARVAFTGTTTTGSASVTVSSATGVTVSDRIFGAGIPTGATVTAISGTTLTISANATASASGVNLWTAHPSDTTTSPLTDITDAQAQVALAGGIPLSQFTEVTADVSSFVYVAGRDADSGTRFSEFSESGFGAFSLPDQAQVNVNGTAGAGGLISNISQYPAQTLFGTNYPIGAGGYNSGGTLADLIATPGSQNAADGATPMNFGAASSWLVAYLGRSDANRAVLKTAGPNTAHRLTFNGVRDWPAATATDAQISTYNNAAIQEGHYKAWSYELAYYRPQSTDAPAVQSAKATAANAIANRILNNDAGIAGIDVNTMNVSKTVEGGLITHL
jgi:hypothetical protein